MLRCSNFNCPLNHVHLPQCLTQLRLRNHIVVVKPLRFGAVFFVFSAATLFSG
jgi:hypothetical protein